MDKMKAFDPQTVAVLVRRLSREPFCMSLDQIKKLSPAAARNIIQRDESEEDSKPATVENIQSFMR